jgi:hypothetical protein
LLLISQLYFYIEYSILLFRVDMQGQCQNRQCAAVRRWGYDKDNNEDLSQFEGTVHCIIISKMVEMKYFNYQN